MTYFLFFSHETYELLMYSYILFIKSEDKSDLMKFVNIQEIIRHFKKYVCFEIMFVYFEIL